MWRSTRTHTSRSSSAACIWSTGRTTTSTSRPTAHAGSLRSGSLPTLHGSRRCGARLRWATGKGMRSARTTTVISAARAASPPGRRETGVSSSTSSTGCSSGGDLRCRSAPGRSSAAAHHASKAISTRSIPSSQDAVSVTTRARRRCSAHGRRSATGSGAFRCSSCRLSATRFASSRWTTTSWPTRATKRLPRSRKRPIARSGTDFRASYLGNRAPLSLGNHFETWKRWAYNHALTHFLLRACRLPDVRCGSFEELANWLDAISPERLARFRAGRFPRPSVAALNRS